jgi:prepilin-type N-terminal cleavage/methylation domain-containing protein
MMRISLTGTRRRSKGIQAFRRSGVQGSDKGGHAFDFAGPERLNARTPERLNAAFTLIELLVVLIALVVMAAAVVPALHGAGHQQDLAGVATRVAASARFARNEAIERQAAIVLTVEPSPAVIRLAVDDSGALGGQAPVTMGTPGSMGMQASALPLPSTYALVRLPSRVQARLEVVPETLNGSVSSMPASGSNLEMLRFPPDGRTTGGMVVLTDNRGRTVRLTVAPDMGVVRVETGGR